MEDSGPATPRGRILVIDDDRVFGLWATKALESRGFEVQHVLDPMTGLREIEAEHWDVVITDVEMPRMSGLEFLERMRRLVPGLPVVVVTAHPTVDRAVTAMRQPDTDFINKPITPEEFAGKVAALVVQGRPGPAAAQESVLAIGAHPGDVELGAGGALLAHHAAGATVTVLTLARGAGDVPGPDGAGTAIGTWLGPDELGAGERLGGAAIESVLAQAQPTVLYTHTVHDAQADHRNAHLAAMAAAGRVGQVYCFQSPSATIDFRPTRFVAIDDHLGGKLRAVAAFAVEPEVRGFLEPDQVTPTALYWGRYCEARHAEAFEVIRNRAAGVAPGRPEAAEAAV
jgi:CheY-like chemotaxis protein